MGHLVEIRTNYQKKGYLSDSCHAPYEADNAPARQENCENYMSML